MKKKCQVYIIKLYKMKKKKNIYIYIYMNILAKNKSQYCNNKNFENIY